VDSSGVNLSGNHPTLSTYHTTGGFQRKQKWIRISDKQQ